ncbi:NO-inducible flavohemoprotein [Pararhizobium sp. PWRC1-1]|uniref:NO-inducible flavohemoprotein n=1 Tax=Pararhizobium sp. PWRC1-1 TaxID=2804566 RepID=UPI003CF7C95B
MPRTLTEHTKSIVRATVPALAEHGAAITAAMYGRLFQNEDVKALFNQSNQGGEGRQTHALAHAILAYAQNIDNLEVLTAAVERISQKHVSLRILPEHYPHVASALLAAIEDVLGHAATDEILTAWGEAYWFLAEILMGREETIYTEQAAAEGGWTGWRDFVVESKQRESSIISSFVLRPADGGPVSRHLPGQYITLLLPVPGKAPQRRNYSISSGPNDHTYRITVKREPHGVVSSILHDQVQEGDRVFLAPPSGDFFLAHDTARPIVLLSGGVGLTPMVSMLESIIEDGTSAPLFFVHATQHGDVHAMGDHVRALADIHPEIRAAVFYTSPRDGDEHGRHYDHSGRIDMEWLSSNTPLAEAEFYLCGPKGFLSAMVGGLASQGVDNSRIHYEFFGPAVELAL